MTRAASELRGLVNSMPRSLGTLQELCAVAGEYAESLKGCTLEIELLRAMLLDAWHVSQSVSQREAA